MKPMHRIRRPAHCRAAVKLRPVGAPLAALLALIVVAALGLARPAYPQWREGATANPAAALDSRVGNLAGYAQMVDTWGNRLAQAVREAAAKAPADTETTVLSRPRMHLLDTAQTAWSVIRNVPEGFGDRTAYETAERQFETSLTYMRVASTPTPRALEEARKIIAALETLEAAAAEAARAAAR